MGETTYAEKPKTRDTSTKAEPHHDDEARRTSPARSSEGLVPKMYRSTEPTEATSASDGVKYGAATAEGAHHDSASDFQKGWDEARQDTAAPKADDPFGSGHGTKQEVGGKHVGEGGFGARLIEGSSASARANADEWGVVAKPVHPVTEPLDQAYEQQARAIERLNTGAKDSDWIGAEKRYSIAWGTENMTSIERYKFEQMRWVNAYSDWSPLANGAHTAMAELVETASLMGFDTSKDLDSVRFIQSLEMSIDMACRLVDTKMLGAGKQQSWSTRNDDPYAVSRARPELPGSGIEERLSKIKQAYRELQLAHHKVYESLLSDQADELARSENKTSDEIKEINETIEFWAGIGEFAQGAASIVAPVVKGEVGAKLDKHFGNGDQYANHELRQAKKHAAAAERNPSDYESDIASHAHHGNYEDHFDTWGAGGTKKLETFKKAQGEHGGAGGAEHEGTGGTVAEGAAEPTEAPELSVGGVIKMGLKLWNKGKLDELEGRLQGIRTKKGANAATTKMVRSLAATDSFRSAAQTFEETAKLIGPSSLRQREQDMVNLGHELDSYAVEHAGDLQEHHRGGLVPKSGREIYATAMAALAKVQKYRALSDLSLSTFPYDEFRSSSRAMQNERSGVAQPHESAGRSYMKTGRPPPRLPTMGTEEQEVYQQIGGTYLLVVQSDAHWGVRLAGVEQRFTTLMQKLSGGANIGAQEGRKF